MMSAFCEEFERKFSLCLTGIATQVSELKRSRWERGRVREGFRFSNSGKRRPSTGSPEIDVIARCRLVSHLGVFIC